MNQPHIILITPGFTADESDRNCLPTLQLYVLELLHQEINVSVVALDYPFSTIPYQWCGAKVYPCGGRNSRWRKPHTVRRAVQICQRLLDQPPPNSGHTVVHSFWFGWASGIGEYLARRHHVIHITTLMGQDVLPANRHWFRFISPERIKRWVVLSEYQNDHLEQTTGYRASHVIPWGVSQAEIPKTISQIRPIDVLGVGSLIPLKNWGLWLETIAILAKKNPGIRVELIGGGPERSRLQHLSDQLGLAPWLTFSGDLPRPLVLEKMQSAKFLLHTSHFESQGYVICEAAMNGCKIVSTPVGIAPFMGKCAHTAWELADLLTVGSTDANSATTLVPFLMSDTVASYRKLYGIDSKPT